ncbi:MAG: hypothetical protein GF334_00435 [Candidatus Altiarchaeales archaeon]|nr:hypothetical protein [Candidatus Altiarchaeales archaeon]
MTIDIPQGGTLFVRAGGLKFKISRFAHERGEGFYIHNQTPGQAGTIYEIERSHEELAQARDWEKFSGPK